MAPGVEQLLNRRWVHAHEEDGEGTMVFRPASDPLPPSRGRTWFELRPDGSFVESSPGPVDVPETSDGRWSLQGDRLVLRAAGDFPGHDWRIVSAEEGGLVLADERSAAGSG
jgi:hypothetical protein